MALLFIDGMDYYPVADVGQRWSGWQTFFGGVSMGTGRFGVGQCLDFFGNTGQGQGSFLYKDLGVASTKLVYGGAIILPNYSPILSFRSGGAVQVDCRFLSTGQVQVTRNGTVLGTSATVGLFTAGDWFYLEFSALISTTIGTIDVQVNGVNVLSLTGQNTQAQAGNTVGTVFWTGPPQTTSLDDVYICDGTGGTPFDTFQGDQRVYYLPPTGTGTTTTLVPTGVVDNWDAVNDTTEDGDSTYVASSVAGDYDTYTLTDLPTSVTVKAVQTILVARKDDAGARTIAPVLRIGGTDYPGTAVGLGGAYSLLPQIYTQDPAGSPWTKTTVDAMELGPKIVS